MTDQLRDRLALALAVVAVALGVGTLAIGRHDPGVRLAPSNEYVVVTQVNAHSQAALAGLAPGMIVVQLNGAELVDLPAFVFPADAPDGYDYETGEPVEPIGIEPERPTPLPMGVDEALTLISAPYVELAAIHPSALERGSAERGYEVQGIWEDGRNRIAESALSVLVGIVLLAAAGWFVGTGRGGAALAPLALPLALAVAAPFLLRPLEATSSPVGIALFGMLTPLAMVPLASALADRVEDARTRRIVQLGAVASAAGAVAVGFALALQSPGSSAAPAWWGLTSAIALLPGLAAAGPLPETAGPAAPSSGRLLQFAEYAVAGATPAVALLTDGSPYLFPVVLWIWLIVAAGRFTIRPLVRLATRATLQRDLVVAATEAERARVAADIHDDALQELTMLVRRLDASGDTEGADIARTVSDRLRAICGDLRLPILDDLGVGPALDWLVLRIERIAGGEVRLERSDGTRPPPEVELAIFRIAQEALANAVKHGRPPIVVRYRTTEHGASLSIDDAGPGIGPDAGDVAERSGRFGLLNMAQRAEQIGAILDIRRWPSGGTHVQLDWRPR